MIKQSPSGNLRALNKSNLKMGNQLPEVGEKATLFLGQGNAMLLIFLCMLILIKDKAVFSHRKCWVIKTLYISQTELFWLQGVEKYKHPGYMLPNYDSVKSVLKSIVGQKNHDVICGTFLIRQKHKIAD